MLDVGADVFVWFEPADTGGLSMFVTVDDGDPIIHIPVTVVKYTPELLEEFVGDYHSRELTVSYRVSINDDGLLIDIPRQEKINLVTQFSDGFSDKWGSIYQFKRDSEGHISELLLTSGRVRNLEFNRVR